MYISIALAESTNERHWLVSTISSHQDTPWHAEPNWEYGHIKYPPKHLQSSSTWIYLKRLPALCQNLLPVFLGRCFQWITATRFCKHRHCFCTLLQISKMCDWLLTTPVQLSPLCMSGSCWHLQAAKFNKHGNFEASTWRSNSCNMSAVFHQRNCVASNVTCNCLASRNKSWMPISKQFFYPRHELSHLSSVSAKV